MKKRKIFKIMYDSYCIKTVEIDVYKNNLQRFKYARTVFVITKYRISPYSNFNPNYNVTRIRIRDKYLNLLYRFYNEKV